MSETFRPTTKQKQTWGSLIILILLLSVVSFQGFPSERTSLGNANQNPNESAQRVTTTWHDTAPVTPLSTATVYKLPASLKKKLRKPPSSTICEGSTCTKTVYTKKTKCVKKIKQKKRFVCNPWKKKTVTYENPNPQPDPSNPNPNPQIPVPTPNSYSAVFTPQTPALPPDLRGTSNMWSNDMINSGKARDASNAAYRRCDTSNTITAIANYTQAPDATVANAITHKALQEVANTTGYTINFLGDTTLNYKTEWQDTDDTPDLWISFLPASDSEFPADYVLGVGSISYYDTDAPPIVGSYAVVKTTPYGSNPNWFTQTPGADSAYSVLLHEIGHAVGMAHYTAADSHDEQVMNPYLDSLSAPTYQIGDRAGLAFQGDLC